MAIQLALATSLGLWAFGAGASPAPVRQRQQVPPVLAAARGSQPAEARASLSVVDPKTNSLVRLMPDGLLDGTLLSNGSFSFGTKTVHFDKLRVLGNVHVKHVNGRPLRDTYLFRAGQVYAGPASSDSGPRPHRTLPLSQLPVSIELDELRLQLL